MDRREGTRNAIIFVLDIIMYVCISVFKGLFPGSTIICSRLMQYGCEVCVHTKIYIMIYMLGM